MESANNYIDHKINGLLFPSWMIKNFSEYKLDKIYLTDGKDPCNDSIPGKITLRNYQSFLPKYMGPNSPYHEILLYHNMGSGKTLTVINLINSLYASNKNYNFVILIKAALYDDPWISDMLKFLKTEFENPLDVNNLKRSEIFQKIHFVNFDSPYADKSFIDTIKKIDTGLPTLYVIDECHLFFRNVYSNINSDKGKRASTIYDFILKDRIDNYKNKLVLISGTPGINVPFELSLTFNLLRPHCLPSTESEFNRLFVSNSSYPILNPLTKNLFQRRIMGLVSYYIGGTPDYYAKQESNNVILQMSDYQYSVYRPFEKYEIELEKKKQRIKKKSDKSDSLYKTYTRQACNFVFPYINSEVNGTNRPRPSKFAINLYDADEISRGKMDKLDVNTNKYLQTVEKYLKELENYFTNIFKEDEKLGHTLLDDLEFFKQNYMEDYENIYECKNIFRKYYFSDAKKSKLLNEMYNCSPKMTAILFYTNMSPGKVMVYSNYVIMEGIDILKIYFRMGGYNDYTKSEPFKGYCEYHGRIDKKVRTETKNLYNMSENILGKTCKIIFLSPSATEGIQLLNIRQEHCLEHYWNKVRVKQVLGRGIRQCSHKELKKIDRKVKIFIYTCAKPDTLDVTDFVRMSTDEYIDDRSSMKDNLMESFLIAMKEVALDCDLFKEHNKISQTYNCFKFSEQFYDNMGPKGINSGPSYKEDIKDDIKYNVGMNSEGTYMENVRVVKIKAAYKDTPTVENFYWFNQNSGIVYDIDDFFPIGKIYFVDGLPEKIDKDTYLISVLYDIPKI